MFKMSDSFIQNLLYNSSSFTSSRVKDLCQKWKEKQNVSWRLQAARNRNVECLGITEVGCNLKQFDSLTWLTLTPRFYDRSTPLFRRSLQLMPGPRKVSWRRNFGACWCEICYGPDGWPALKRWRDITREMGCGLMLLLVRRISCSALSS